MHARGGSAPPPPSGLPPGRQTGVALPRSLLIPAAVLRRSMQRIAHVPVVAQMEGLNATAQRNTRIAPVVAKTTTPALGVLGMHEAVTPPEHTFCTAPPRGARLDGVQRIAPVPVVAQTEGLNTTAQRNTRIAPVVAKTTTPALGVLGKHEAVTPSEHTFCTASPRAARLDGGAKPRMECLNDSSSPVRGRPTPMPGTGLRLIVDDTSLATTRPLGLMTQGGNAPDSGAASPPQAHSPKLFLSQVKTDFFHAPLTQLPPRAAYLTSWLEVGTPLDEHVLPPYGDNEHIRDFLACALPQDDDDVAAETAYLSFRLGKKTGVAHPYCVRVAILVSGAV